jgi:undecaprenyl diphosphate synthase
MSDLIKNISLNNVPQHVAVIMDGNGRWAKKNGYLRAIGHKNGTRAVREVVEACSKLNIKTLTLYAFSTDNWNRPKPEVDALMELLVTALSKELETFKTNNIKLHTIGETNQLPDRCQKKLGDVITQTKNNTGLNLVLALSYSSKTEIINAIKSIASDVLTNQLRIEDITEEDLDKKLYTSHFSNPDLLIRTSGEQRISNFLLWQIAYSELYFCDRLWPDFTKNDFYQAVIEYQKRERRFGKTSDQLNS